MNINTLNHLLNHPINKKQRIKAVIRYIKWQLGSRLIPGAVVFNWINNSKAIISTGETGMTGDVYAGLHEFPDMAFVLHALHKEDLFVDIGANIGSYTILACSVIGAKGICFEPVPSTYDKLVMNTKINNLENKVSVLNKALGEEEGIISFSSEYNCMNHVIAEDEIIDDKHKVDVNISTLDNEISDDNIPFMIKIDVEGYETPALKGAKRILNNNNLSVVIMELNGSGNRYGFDENKILQMMFDYGFKAYSYEPFTRKLTDLKAKNLEEGNTIFIRNKDDIEKRINKSPKIDIYGIFV